MTLSYPATLSQLRVRVRRRLLTQESGTATDNWNNGKIDDAINRAQRMVHAELLQSFSNVFKKAVTTVPVNNRIDHPQDLFRIDHMDREAGDALGWRPVRIVTSSRYYEFQAGVLQLDVGNMLVQTDETWIDYHDHLEPAAGNSAHTGTYRLTYYMKPVDLQKDDDVPLIPDTYHDFLVAVAAEQMARDAGQVERSQLLRGEIQEQLSLMKRTATNEALTQQHRVRRARSWRI